MTVASNFLAFVALGITLLLVWRQSWRGRVRLFVVQSWVLAALAVTLGALVQRPALVAVGAVFAVMKTWIIPRVLRRMGHGSPPRPVAPGRSAGLSVLAAGGLVVVAYAVMLPITGAVATGVPTRGAIPLAFAVALIGLFVCVTGRDALGQVIGFLVFENGLFALAVLATYGLPGIVEAGAFLEVLVLVLLMEGVLVQIRREHDSLDIQRLRELRG
jgi:hydrogenase-4 component E